MQRQAQASDGRAACFQKASSIHLSRPLIAPNARRDCNTGSPPIAATTL
jgi:hypothetical protein